MPKLWGMPHSQFVLVSALNIVLIFLIACVWGARAGVPATVLGIVGALAMWGAAVATAKVWLRYAK